MDFIPKHCSSQTICILFGNDARFQSRADIISSKHINFARDALASQEHAWITLHLTIYTMCALRVVFVCEMRHPLRCKLSQYEIRCEKYSSKTQFASYFATCPPPSSAMPLDGKQIQCTRDTRDSPTSGIHIKCFKNKVSSKVAPCHETYREIAFSLLFLRKFSISLWSSPQTTSTESCFCFPICGARLMHMPFVVLAYPFTVSCEKTFFVVQFCCLPSGRHERQETQFAISNKIQLHAASVKSPGEQLHSNNEQMEARQHKQTVHNCQ